MHTRTITVDPADIAPEAIEQAVTLLRSGQPVAFPTETVYGLGANALDDQAVARIFEAKGRPTTDPLIVHVQSPEQLAEVTTDVPAVARRLIDQFWPGPLTLVLARSERISPAVSAGLPTVAVRMPAHPVALALLTAARLPIAAPSANRFAHSSPTTARHVLDDLDGKIPLILDGGPTIVGVESTIVDLTGTRPRLLRPGGVAAEIIMGILPDLEIVTRHAAEADGALPAPGMLLKHYSPRAELRLFDGPDDAVRAAMRTMANELTTQGQRIGLLIADEDRPYLAAQNWPLVPVVPVVSLGSLRDLEQIARNLFAGLRDIDSQSVAIILARSYPPTGIGLAVRDRLTRAAEGRVIHV